MLNLRAVDLNLLPVFEAVYEERNVTKAADRLAMSQPAVSHAVARLRTMVGDELFVAGRRGRPSRPRRTSCTPASRPRWRRSGKDSEKRATSTRSCPNGASPSESSTGPA